MDYKKIDLEISFLRRGIFLNRYNHKGQVKISPYTRYMSVFKNPSKLLYKGLRRFIDIFIKKYFKK